MNGTHIVKRYAGGIGHIDQTDAGYLVSFYGRRVVQNTVNTLAEARTTLRQMASDPRVTR